MLERHRRRRRAHRLPELTLRHQPTSATSTTTRAGLSSAYTRNGVRPAVPTNATVVPSKVASKTTSVTTWVSPASAARPRTPRRRCRTGSPCRSGSPGGRRPPPPRPGRRCPATSPRRRSGRPSRASRFHRPRTRRGRNRRAGRGGCRSRSPGRRRMPPRCRARRPPGRPARRAEPSSSVALVGDRVGRRRLARLGEGGGTRGAGVRRRRPPQPASTRRAHEEGRQEEGDGARSGAHGQSFAASRPRAGVRHGAMYCFFRPRRTTSPHRLVVQDAALSRR